jgi:quercetin dioxygenase-like cupin family protein
MKQKLTGSLLLIAVLGVATLYPAEKAHATQSQGFTSTTLAQGRLGAIDVSNYFVPEKGKTWLSFQKTQGKSDLYVQDNVWQAGGSTGWHSHPGHSLIVVTEGTVTAYEGDDPSCTPHVYTVGMSFVDRGGNHVHIIRNETASEAQTIAVQLIPAKQPRRIDAPPPGNCPF